MDELLEADIRTRLRADMTTTLRTAGYTVEAIVAVLDALVDDAMHQVHLVAETMIQDGP